MTYTFDIKLYYNNKINRYIPYSIYRGLIERCSEDFIPTPKTYTISYDEQGRAHGNCKLETMNFDIYLGRKELAECRIKFEEALDAGLLFQNAK